jgi:hypothetical protein
MDRGLLLSPKSENKKIMKILDAIGTCWKGLQNHMKAYLNTFQMSTNVMGFNRVVKLPIFSDFGDKSRPPSLKPYCIRCSHFKIDDVSALEASSEPPVRIVEDNVTASLQRTP